jgi:clan AA aspartic protease
VGEVKVEVELENSLDRELAVRGAIAEDDIRSVRVAVLADTGSVLLMLPQELVELLGLRELRKAIVTYADERKEERPIAGVVTVRVGNRAAETACIVGPPNSEPLLGQTPLEIMDLLVDCPQQKLVPRPESPYLPLIKLK